MRDAVEDGMKDAPKKKIIFHSPITMTDKRTAKRLL
jgi:hypothetical protein